MRHTKFITSLDSVVAVYYFNATKKTLYIGFREKKEINNDTAKRHVVGVWRKKQTQKIKLINKNNG